MLATLTADMAKEKIDREYLGARVEKMIKRRLEAVARAKKLNLRIILEQIVEKELPGLEREAGILREEPAPYGAVPKGKKGS